MKKTMLKSFALAVVGSLCAVGAANAAMLEGGLSMTGTYTPVDVNYAFAEIPVATGIDFGGLYTGGTDNTFGVGTATGDFASLVGGSVQTTGTIENFQFIPFTATPGTPLWTVGAFSFEMTSLTWEKDVVAGNNDIHIYGLGMMSAAGYDDTPGVWNFTGQGVDDANFSWSASAGTSPVPEPATMLLFGTGLIGLAGVRRKLSK